MCKCAVIYYVGSVWSSVAATPMGSLKFLRFILSDWTLRHLLPVKPVRGISAHFHLSCHPLHVPQILKMTVSVQPKKLWSHSPVFNLLTCLCLLTPCSETRDLWERWDFFLGQESKTSVSSLTLPLKIFCTGHIPPTCSQSTLHSCLVIFPSPFVPYLSCNLRGKRRNLHEAYCRTLIDVHRCQLRSLAMGGCPVIFAVLKWDTE